MMRQNPPSGNSFRAALTALPFFVAALLASTSARAQTDDSDAARSTLAVEWRDDDPTIPLATLSTEWELAGLDAGRSFMMLGARARFIDDWKQYSGMRLSSLRGVWEPWMPAITPAYRRSPQARMSVGGANRNYNLRLRGQYFSGTSGDWRNLGRNGPAATAKGWSYGVAASAAWGWSLPVQGTRNDQYLIDAAVSKAMASEGGAQHQFSLNFFFEPRQRATQSASVAEAFALTGNNLYNPAWGVWDAGAPGSRPGTPRSGARNARVSEYLTPVVALGYEYLSPSGAFSLVTTLRATAGHDSYSGLNWQHAPNPRPDYYRYMPSYQSNSYVAGVLAELWRTDPTVSQIDWQALADLNAYNGERAHYILEKRVTQRREAVLNSTAQLKFSDFSSLEFGIRLTLADDKNFKVMDDLLGAAYWLDIDNFAENDEDTRNQTQNDIRNPNRQIAAGDRCRVGRLPAAAGALLRGCVLQHVRRPHASAPFLRRLEPLLLQLRDAGHRRAACGD